MELEGSSMIMPDNTNFRNRSDSLEEATLMDDQQQRKRPRLDSAEATTTKAILNTQEVTNDRESIQCPDPLTPPIPAAMATSPTSKVTINTRSSNHLTQTPSHDMASPLAPNISAAEETTLVDVLANTANAHEEPISISSSPSKSPEIQVAEVEDFEQDSNETRWQPFGKLDGSRFLTRNYVWETFPYAQGLSKPREVSAVLIKVVEFLRDTDDITALFNEIRKWLADLLELQGQITLEFLEDEYEFWSDLPDIVNALLRRDEGLSKQILPQEFESFLGDYARLVTRLIRIDLDRLRKYTPTTESKDIFDLYCRPYLMTLTFSLQYRDIPLYSALIRSRVFGLPNIISAVIDKITDPNDTNILEWLLQIVTELGPVLPKKIALNGPFLHLIRAVVPFTKTAAERILYGADPLYSESIRLSEIREKSLEVFMKADEIFQHAVIKQLPWLTIDNSGDFLRQFNTGFTALADQIPGLGLQMVTNTEIVSAEFSLEEAQHLANAAWKFKTLRKYITNGRMELRVHGVDEIQSELVLVYKNIIQNDPNSLKLPLVRFLVAFIRDMKLISYLIGVDSHPQLINRSSNIIGFLCVTGSYEDSDTDMMWRTFTESQDPRTVKEVHYVMKETSKLADIPANVYFCNKLLEVPVENYDSPLIDFCGTVLDSLRSKMHQAPERYPLEDPCPLRLCVQLLRGVSASTRCSLEQLSQIRQLIWSRLPLLLPQIPNGEEKQKLWSQCFDDIIADNEYATGSMEVLNCWLESFKNRDAVDLQSDFTPTVIQNSAHFASTCAMRPVGDSSAIYLAFEARLNMVSKLILYKSETITPDLLKTLWTEVFTSSHLPESFHFLVWDILTKIIKFCGLGSNHVIDTILEVYLPNLSPENLNRASLDFIKQVVEYEMRAMKDSIADDVEVVELPCMERVWTVVLEAPPNTVEGEAADFIMQKYLDHELIRRKPASCIRATHGALVDRCVRQVITSATKLKSFTDGTMSGEDEPMVIIAPETEIRAEEMRFDRSLLFLRKFLEGLKQRPMYSPAVNKQVIFGGGSNFEKKGEVINLKLQIFGSSRLTNGARRLLLGEDNTTEETWEYLSDLTGFEDFTIINGGRNIARKDFKHTLGETRIMPGTFIVKKTRDSHEKMPQQAGRASSPVDSKVMDHFNELYELLDLDERLAREVYVFLSLFPADYAVVDKIRTQSASTEDLLPLDKPYRLLYCARALRSCIEAESFGSEPDTRILEYAVKAITTTFAHLDSTGNESQLRFEITKSLLESLLLALRAKVSSEVSMSYINDHQGFVDSLVVILQKAIAQNSSRGDLQNLVSEPFDALIEGALHDDRLWQTTMADSILLQLLSGVMLENTHVEVRKAFCNVFLGLTGSTGNSGKLRLKVNDPRAPRARFPPEAIHTTLSHLWEIIVEILPNTVRSSSQSQQFFDAAIAVLRHIGKSLSTDDVSNYFIDWSIILASHRHVETVGCDDDDHLVSGFAKLLQECCKLLRIAKVAPPCRGLAEKLLSNFLFPALSSDTGPSNSSLVPVLDSSTRADLYDLVFHVSEKDEDLVDILNGLQDIIARDMYFEPHLTNERLSLRSEVGYAGLRNLANTCYLNSLFSQLFMNVRFRDLLIRAKICDTSRQNLLVELGKVFSRMQNAYAKYIDPIAAVESITTYDNEHIDVAIQMDVDEFYNLLFDRLEGQFSTQDAKETFQSLYGGQLVQQIKSKECEHISERFERFMTVQLEIKGKSGLADSLNSYVEGEILQGDNKYRCSDCERHVDAVKRACLKDIPDHLIFNLKRFDYDIMTGTRAKVNDEFQFPDSIDMAPYTVDALSNPNRPVRPDKFELVGVIVHTGTADSGHYYSFTRQRPSSKDKAASWCQFNDSEVSVFDPQQMRESTFGGVEQNVPFPYTRIFSAYMLFYQRTASIQKLEEAFPNHDITNPVRLPLADDHEEHINRDNELYLQAYCVQDPSHARFMLALLGRMRNRETRQCSAGHEAESSLLTLCLDYVQQVSSRWKDQPEVAATMKMLESCTLECSDCAEVVANWYLTNRIIRDTILKSPYPMVRSVFSSLIFAAFKQLFKASPSTTEGKHAFVSGKETERYQTLLKKCVEAFDELWGVLPRFGRAWDEYFSLLAAFVDFGSWEALQFLNSGFLERVVELVMAHTGNMSKSIREKVKLFAAWREKNRVFHFGYLLHLLERLLSYVDIDTVSLDEEREIMSDGMFGVNCFEATLLGTDLSRGTRPRFEWLRKATIGRQNPNAVTSIFEKLASSKTTSPDLVALIVCGITDSNIGLAVAYLRPALVFCRSCANVTQVNDVALAILNAISTIGLQYGREHLEFVYHLARLENQNIGWNRTKFRKIVLTRVGAWAPPLLFNSNDHNEKVAEETVTLLKDLLYTPYAHPNLDPDRKRVYLMQIKGLTEQCAVWVKENVLQNSKDRIILQHSQADTIMGVMRTGLEQFDPDNAEEEVVIAHIQLILAELKAKSDAVVAISPDWNDDSDVADFSEVSGMNTP